MDVCFLIMSDCQDYHPNNSPTPPPTTRTPPKASPLCSVLPTLQTTRTCCRHVATSSLDAAGCEVSGRSFWASLSSPAEIRRLERGWWNSRLLRSESRGKHSGPKTLSLTVSPAFLFFFGTKTLGFQPPLKQWVLI